MKITNTGITLLSSLMLATPTFAQVAGQSASTIASTSENLFISTTTFIAENDQGFTRKVVLAVRIAKNTESGFNKCDLKDRPDSITIEVLDPQTKKVLAVGSRLFGSIQDGMTDLFKVSSSYGCLPERKDLTIQGNTLVIVDSSNKPQNISISGFGTINVPTKLIFKR